MITVCKVVSRNFVVDLWGRVQNFFGSNLSGYEHMVNTAIQQCKDEVDSKALVLDWYRFEITQVTNGAIMVLLYGETKK